MLVKFNCNRCARWSSETATNMPVGSKQRLKHGYCNMPASLGSCYRHKCFVSDMCAGPVPRSQICVMVNISADPVAMMPGHLVERK